MIFPPCCGNFSSRCRNCPSHWAAAAPSEKSRKNFSEKGSSTQRWKKRPYEKLTEGVTAPKSGKVLFSEPTMISWPDRQQREKRWKFRKKNLTSAGYTAPRPPAPPAAPDFPDWNLHQSGRKRRLYRLSILPQTAWDLSRWTLGGYRSTPSRWAATGFC